MDTYTTGNVIKATATFTQGGTNTDPTTVAFKVRSVTPAGTTTTTTYTYGTDAEVTKTATGTYQLLAPADIDATWTIRAYSTGTAKAAIETGFVTVGELD